MTPRHFLLVSLLLNGCIVQGGAYAGATLHPGATSPGVTHGGQLQTRFAFGINQVPLHVGLELSGRAEKTAGSTATWGIQLGTVLGQHRAAFAPYVDLGSPVGWNNPVAGYYVGATFELPVRLTERSASEVNRSYRFIDSEGAIVPFVRLRRVQLAVRSVDQPVGYECVAGIAVRTQVVTDLMDFTQLF